MIRVNLIPDRDARHRGAQIDTLAVVFIALLFLEVMMLGLAYVSADEELSGAQRRATAAKKTLDGLKKDKEALAKKEAKQQELQKQNAIFDTMRSRTTGPARMLQFLSYSLTKPEENLYNRDEIAGQEKAGWAPSWDPENVWLAELKQEPEFLTLKGRARDHEDVTEFQRRLETSPYFYCVDLVVQEKVEDPDFKDLELISFEVEAGLTFDPEGKITMLSEELPTCLLPLLEQVAKEQAAPGGDDAGADAKPAGEGGS